MKTTLDVKLAIELRRCATTVSGFTLIEVMVSVALAAMLLLIAISAFRAVTSTFRTVNRLGQENSLLRLGFQLSLDDADYRHSEANPDAPYGKGWAQRSTFKDSWVYRRPYQKVVFSRDLDKGPQFGVSAPGITESPASNQIFLMPNPNVLPHDPRSWFREQAVWQNMTPVMWSEYRGGLPALPNDRFDIYGQYNQVCATDMRSSLAIEACRPDGTAYGARIPVPDGFQPDLVNSYNPALRCAMFNVVSYIGSRAYASPGAPIVMWDQFGRLPNWFNNGAQSASSPQAVGVVPSGWSQYNYLQDTGKPNDKDEGMERWTRNRLFWDQFLGTAAGSSGNMPLLIKPVFEDTTAGAGGAQIANGNYDYYQSAKPFEWRMYKQGQMNDAYGAWEQAANVTSTTVRFPWNQADAETLSRVHADRPSEMETWPLQIPLNVADVPAGMPMMRTSIVRLNAYAGTNLTYARVTVVSTDSGQVIELGFTPIGTDYRGARQHWGLASNGAFGDNYAR